ncbi:restriction endonuclease subunit S [Holdemanella biformis]|uniref:Restriction endonuclease subunit S n=1 Tax=Holdemanella biformis TaxID=1735 RepID=A0A395W7J9_9FIRM|nr:restriction endonuclease subunit S [Holdemanella biformis]RGU90346.1 restriction endonuclease subunit S [Holdemanella biformis]
MKVKVGEITKIKTGKLDANASSADGKYPFFTCSKDPLRINSYSYDCECVLVAGNGDLNVKYYNGKFDAYQRTYIIEDNSNGLLYMPYLYHFLEGYIGELRKQSIGGVIKYIKLGNLTDVLVELPSIEEQKYIVNLMNISLELIELRKKTIDKLDSLVKARFIEMFGRPFINNLNWESKQIKNVVNEVKYGTSKPSVENGKYKYLRMNNLTYDGRFDLTDLKFISLDNDELEKCVVRKGDVLFNRTNSLDLIGKTAEFDFNEDMVIAGYIIRIRLKETIVPKFFSMYMNTDEMKLHLRTIAKGAVNQANINAQELQEIPIYLPPIELQNQFVNFVRQVDKSREAVKKSLEKTQQLYDSLMQEYFG